MLHYFALWLLYAFAFLITAYLVPGIRITGLLPAMAAAAALGLIHMLIRPILVILTLPITIVTFGLFLLVINGLCFWLAATVIPGFEIRGLGPAIIGSVVLTIVGWGLNQLVMAL